MKKLCSVVLVAAIVVAGAAPLAEAGGRGGWHGGGWRGGNWGGARVGFRGGVFIGSPFWGPTWGPWWGPWGYPGFASWAPPVPLFAAPPVVIQQQPQVFIQQQPQPTVAAPQSSFWYFCPDSRTYYPYVQQCASGWLTVVPPTGSAAPEVR